NRYEVTLDERAGALSLRCTCMAGRHGMRCRHVKALAVGDVTDLLSDNAADLARVLGLLAAVP
ncbi:DNA polymerase III, partial [Methylobacterium hispanicum]